ncbi:nuclear transport factor 2 family protein [Brevibacterium sp. HMSC07C04]|uniref:nuclear transport factor 2 family protein n=1 Tax=Brevibacterium sp. HMSC07C04 TaxID=1581130 RepID=UPI002109B82D|nr:nuclear transport factor 2 family protein [Brevibacterium sp. HMSC07C04]
MGLLPGKHSGFAVGLNGGCVGGEGAFLGAEAPHMVPNGQPALSPSLVRVLLWHSYGMGLLTLDTLLDLERAGWDSLCNRAGAVFYGELMTEDGLMVLVNGFIMDRDAVVASLNEAPGWDRYEITDARMVAAGNSAAAIVYKAKASRGDEDPFEAVMSSTYTLVDGKPRLALYQQTTATH